MKTSLALVFLAALSVKVSYVSKFNIHMWRIEPVIFYLTVQIAVCVHIILCISRSAPTIFALGRGGGLTDPEAMYNL
jgi:hypothetical protein